MVPAEQARRILSKVYSPKCLEEEFYEVRSSKVAYSSTVKPVLEGARRRAPLAGGLHRRIRGVDSL